MLKFGFQIYDTKEKTKMGKNIVFKTQEGRNNVIKHNVNDVNKIIAWLNLNS